MTSLRSQFLRPLVVAATCVATLIVLLGETAFAQTKPTIRAIDQTQITRNQPIRGINDSPFWVSRADCVADDEITFSIQVTTPNTNNLEVWAGTADCAQREQRQGNQAECWRVFQGQVVRSPTNVTIRAQDLVARNGPADGSTGVPGTLADCDSEEYVSFSLYFMYVGDGGMVSSNTIVFPSGIDLEAPIPPTITDVQAADNRLLLKWEDSNPGEFAGYRIYCADAVDVSSTDNALTLPDGAVVDGAVTDGVTDGADDVVTDGTTAADSAGGASTTGTLTSDGTVPPLTSPDGGPLPNDSGASPADGGPPTPTGCGGTVLIEGELAPRSRLCGTVSTHSATSAYAKDLVNGRSYAVGLVAIDRLGNESGLSNVRCNTPREVFTFFEDYRSAGGDGGGGFCSFSRGRELGRGGWQWVGLVSLGLGLAMFRRMNNK